MKRICLALLALLCFSGVAFAAEDSALDKLRKQAEAGVAAAQLEYAAKLEQIEGKTTEALAWLEKSAKQGYADAEYLLGTLYFKGSAGLKENYEKAAEWFEKAALQGQKGAQRYMGIYMWNKPDKDLEAGCAWFMLAKDADNIAECERRLTPEQKKTAQSKFEELKKKYPY